MSNKFTSKPLSAPPLGNLGGGAYSSDVSKHPHTPNIWRKSRIKRDTARQFCLSLCIGTMVSTRDGLALSVGQSKCSLPQSVQDVGKAQTRAQTKSIHKAERRVVDSGKGISLALDNKRAIAVLSKIDAKSEKTSANRTKRHAKRKDNQKRVKALLADW